MKVEFIYSFEANNKIRFFNHQCYHFENIM